MIVIKVNEKPAIFHRLGISWKIIIERLIGIMTDNLEATDANAAPVALTALAKAKNEIRNRIPKKAPKIKVSTDQDIAD